MKKKSLIAIAVLGIALIGSVFAIDLSDMA
jgi:hypothetical protein